MAEEKDQEEEEKKRKGKKRGKEGSSVFRLSAFFLYLGRFLPERCGG